MKAFFSFMNNSIVMLLRMSKTREIMKIVSEIYLLIYLAIFTLKKSYRIKIIKMCSFIQKLRAIL